jgi:predicted anti-sigma-YlaC factor YlaD
VLQSVVCERVRSSISLEIDGELSELERRRVLAHLERCPECRAFETDVTAFTDELRSAPLEELDHPLVVRRPRRVSFARVQVGVAAAVAVVAVGALAQIAGSKSENERIFATPDRFMTSTQLAREVNQIVADARAFSHEQGSEMAI